MSGHSVLVAWSSSPSLLWIRRRQLYFTGTIGSGIPTPPQLIYFVDSEKAWTLSTNIKFKIYINIVFILSTSFSFYHNFIFFYSNYLFWNKVIFFSLFALSILNHISSSVFLTFLGCIKKRIDNLTWLFSSFIYI